MKTYEKKLYICCMIAALLTIAFSNLDLVISQAFYTAKDGFYLKNEPFNVFINDKLALYVSAFLALCIGFWLGGKIRKDSVLAIQNKSMLFLISSFLLLPVGLVYVMKWVWQRPRPSLTSYFGGNEAFVSPLVISDNTTLSASFPSGHTAVAFWLLAAALLLPKPIRRKGIGLVIIIGIVTAVSRVVAGYHFASDTIFSALIIVPAVVFMRRAFGLDKEENTQASQAKE